MENLEKIRDSRPDHVAAEIGLARGMRGMIAASATNTLETVHAASGTDDVAGRW